MATVEHIGRSRQAATTPASKRCAVHINARGVEVSMITDTWS
jgi:hypothetical protein